MEITDEELDERSQKQYAMYGKFCIEFERMCEWMRFAIQSSFKKTRDGQKIEILLADQTAKPLIEKLRSIFFEVYRKQIEILEKFDPVFVATVKLIELRNEIVHGRWSVVLENENGDILNQLHGYKHKLVAKRRGGNKNFAEGFQIRTWKYTEEDFALFTKKIMKCRDCYSVISFAFYEQSLVYHDIITKEDIDLLKK